MIHSPEVKKDLLKLGLYQVIGGAIGILIGLLSVFSSDVVNLLLLLLIVLFCSFSIYCGYLCLQNREEGLKWSLVNQALQVVQFTLPLLGFKYAAGIYGGIGISSIGESLVNFDFGLFKLAFSINGGEGLELSINIVAIFLIAWILRLRKTVTEEAQAHVLADLVLDDTHPVSEASADTRAQPDERGTAQGG